MREWGRAPSLRVPVNTRSALAPKPVRSPFANARYVTSAHSLADLPAPLGPEIAFAGRSNAGKSSALNALVQHKRLAFTSKTPGRTQLINFFAVPRGAFFVDLPGYGYAKVPSSMRAHWGQVVAAYLQTRSVLCGLVLIMDARHPFSALDCQLLDWLTPGGKPVHILMTKSDKLSRRECRDAIAEARARLADRAQPGLFTTQLFSSHTGAGVEEAIETLSSWLEPEMRDAGQEKAPGRRETPGDQKTP